MDKKDKIEFNPSKFEHKWQEKWESDKTFSPDLEKAQKPFMNLMMFPYPSAEGLHVGNMYAQTGADVFGRFQRMQGYSVFEPMGLDGFGIHSENYALKVGVHPIKQAAITQERFYKQMKSIGTSIDWSRTLETYDPVYYRWTQWLFIQLFKAGLAYRKKAEVNWCPKDLTVLSDEQVIDGCCERCGAEVEKKELEQWFFKITDYADRLLVNIDGLDWTEKVKIAQRNWIGKSEGLVFTAPVKDTKLHIDTFSAHFEAFRADTFVVIAPDHPFLEQLLEGVENRKEIEDFCKILLEKRKNEKQGEEKEPEGIFTGRYIVDPVGNGDLPIWVANYALKDYGTGIVKCSAHDVRDFAFAKKYDLKLKAVLFPEDLEEKRKVENLEVCFTDMKHGILSEPSEFKGKVGEDVRGDIIKYVQVHKLARPQSNYHLRDWLISRQRYWGPPIPMIYCEHCAAEGKSWFTSSEHSESQRVRESDGSVSQKIRSSESSEFSGMAGWYPVPEDQLPVLLPDVEDWKPMGTGLSPLANHPEFYNVKCPECGKDARRETDVSDTFLDSAWYFLGYISPTITGNSKNKETVSRDITIGQKVEGKSQKLGVPWDPEVEKLWLPVKKYIGGAEHSVLHLLYSRFISMVLADLKFTDFEEPFTSFFAHGLIIKDGAKMSKSKGNVVVPDAYIEKYGADTLRTYLMFLGPFSDGGDFRDSGIEGMNRFLKRVWTLIVSSIEYSVSSKEGETLALDKKMHQTIKAVTADIEGFKYNTAIAKLMEYYNALSAYHTQYGILNTKYSMIFLKLLAPFAPYMTEELWERVAKVPRVPRVPRAEGNQARDTLDTRGTHDTLHSIHLQPWPEYDEKYLTSNTSTIVVQVNGKKRGEFTVHGSQLENEEKIQAEARLLIEKYLESKEPKKIIYVPGKIVNFVVS